MGISKNGLPWAAAAAVLGSLRVFAADTAPESTELETIVVTAEKRSQTEQSVPLSMTTFSAASLREKDVNSFFDYATKVPNLAFADDSRPYAEPAPPLLGRGPPPRPLMTGFWTVILSAPQ